jgi:hypothetical protein
MDVQIVNRVGWDGAVRPPDANEIGWKDTVRMNPLEDIVVALRPYRQALPWDLPNSVRPLDVTSPVGATSAMMYTNVDPTNEPATVVNDMTNFGWEYVWHCHILGHEENDMMRAMALAVPPRAPTTPVATLTSVSTSRPQVTLAFTDNALNETAFTVLRSTSAAGPWTRVGTVPGAAGSGAALTFVDTSVSRRATYYYEVVANNVIGYTRSYAAPAVGYPNLSADAAPAGPSNAVTTQ